jgi:hypothetical protein
MPATCPATSSELSRITTVTIDLWIDEDSARKPGASRMTSAVFLRNQNEPPVAALSSRPLTSRQVILNASASVDPEGRTLEFLWFRAPAPSFTCDAGPPAALLLWQGITLTYSFPAADGPAGTQIPIELVVCDAGSLQSRATSLVSIP